MSYYRKNSPWGYKLDYDKEIAADESLIESTKFCLANGFTNEAAAAFYGTRFESDSHDAVALVIASRRHREVLGLTLDDVADVAEFEEFPETFDSFCDDPLPPVRPGTIDSRRPGAGFNSYVRGREARDRILNLVGGDRYLSSEVALTKRLKKAKAALSRHKRNKLTYGK